MGGAVGRAEGRPRERLTAARVAPLRKISKKRGFVFLSTPSDSKRRKASAQTARDADVASCTVQTGTADVSNETATHSYATTLITRSEVESYTLYSGPRTRVPICTRHTASRASPRAGGQPSRWSAVAKAGDVTSRRPMRWHPASIWVASMRCAGSIRSKAASVALCSHLDDKGSVDAIFSKAQQRYVFSGESIRGQERCMHLPSPWVIW